jgi:hypothetical protein
MFRRIVTVLFGLIACAGLAYQVAGQQPPSVGAQPAGAGGRARGAAPPSPPSLFFKETWRPMGAPHAIAPGEVVITNANFEFKMYGPSATASDPDKRIWISGQPVNIWTGMCATPCAATLRDKSNYMDLTGLSKVRWTTRASGFHAVRPLIKLMDGTFLVGDHADSSTTTFLESEFAFAGLRWIRLDIDRIVTVGRYGPLGEASSWAESPDLSRVDEVGFVDLMPGSGHGSGGYVNVAAFELYGTPVKRTEGK